MPRSRESLPSIADRESRTILVANANPAERRLVQLPYLKYVLTQIFSK